MDDGATLQIGIGAIPDAVLRRLGGRQDLGIHTEMFSDGVVDLVEDGAITNRLKQVHRGRIVTSFVVGTQRVYDFVDDNPFVEFHPRDRTNDTALIRANDKVTAINSALEGATHHPSPELSAERTRRHAAVSWQWGVQ